MINTVTSEVEPSQYKILSTRPTPSISPGQATFPRLSGPAAFPGPLSRPVLPETAHTWHTGPYSMTNCLVMVTSNRQCSGSQTA